MFSNFSAATSASASAESTEPMARENDSPDDDVQRAPSADTPDDAATQSTETPSANEDNPTSTQN